MSSEIEKRSVTASFREAAQTETVRQWFQGLDILFDVVSRMEQKMRSKQIFTGYILFGRIGMRKATRSYLRWEQVRRLQRRLKVKNWKPI